MMSVTMTPLSIFFDLVNECLLSLELETDSGLDLVQFVDDVQQLMNIFRHSQSAIEVGSWSLGRASCVKVLYG